MMGALAAELIIRPARATRREELVAGCALVNAGDVTVRISRAPLSSPALCLEIVDQSAAPVLLPPPPVPGNGDDLLGLAPGERYAVEHGAGPTVLHDANSRYPDPEDTPGFGIGWGFHDMIDQALKRLNSGARLATAEQLGSMHIECGQVGPCTTTPVLVLNPHWSAWLWGKVLWRLILAWMLVFSSVESTNSSSASGCPHTRS